MTVAQADEHKNLNEQEFLVVRIMGQQFGISVLQIEDILATHDMTPIPLAPPEVKGALNLRGRIVTSIDMRNYLGLDSSNDDKSMSVVIEHEDELYSLIVDSVSDVLNVDMGNVERTVDTVDAAWREISIGIYKLDSELLVLLDTTRLLSGMKQ